MPYKNTGKLIPLVYLEKERYRELPDVPTSVEEGFNLFGRIWRGVAAPKGTPRPIIDKPSLSFKKMTEDRSVATVIKQLGDDTQFLGPDAFAKYWQDEVASYKDLAKAIKKWTRGGKGLSCCGGGGIPVRILRHCNCDF